MKLRKKKIEQGKYKITDKITGHTDLVVVERTLRNGGVFIAMLPSSIPPFFMSSCRVASLNWEKVGK
jgi:hypothetical protein